MKKLKINVRSQDKSEIALIVRVTIFDRDINLNGKQVVVRGLHYIGAVSRIIYGYLIRIYTDLGRYNFDLNLK